MSATTTVRGARHTGAPDKEATVSDDTKGAKATKKITVEQYRLKKTTPKTGEVDDAANNDDQERPTDRQSLDERIEAMAKDFGEQPAKAASPV